MPLLKDWRNNAALHIDKAHKIHAYYWFYRRINSITVREETSKLEKNIFKDDFVVLNTLNEEALELLRAHSKVPRVQLWLEGQSVADLDFLLQCENLEFLGIYGGRVADYTAIRKLPKLKELFLNGRLRRWLDSFDFINGAKCLEKLQIMHYPMVTAFPSLDNCVALKEVHITGCKRLEDISSMVRIPNLKAALVYSPLLKLADFLELAKKPGLLMLSATVPKAEREQYAALLAENNLGR